MLLAPLLLALNVQTFDRDPGWSNGPIDGLRQVWIDPATVATAVRPLAAAPGPEFERVENGAGGGLVFTNPVNTWTNLVVNDVRVGELTSYATVRLQGVAPGWYAVQLELSTGFVRKFAVEVR